MVRKCIAYYKIGAVNKAGTKVTKHRCSKYEDVEEMPSYSGHKDIEYDEYTSTYVLFAKVIRNSPGKHGKNPKPEYISSVYKKLKGKLHIPVRGKLNQEQKDKLREAIKKMINIHNNGAMKEVE